MNDAMFHDSRYSNSTPITWSTRPQPRPLTAAPTIQGQTEDLLALPESLTPMGRERPSSSGSESMHVKLAALKLRRLENRRQQLFEEVESCPTQQSPPSSSSPPSRPNTCGTLGSHSSLLRSLRRGTPARQANISSGASSSGSFRDQPTNTKASLLSDLLVQRTDSSSSLPGYSTMTRGHLGDEASLGLSRTDSVESDSADALIPFDNPANELTNAIHVLNVAAAASRLDLNWQAQSQAIKTSRRLLLHHPEHVIGQLHPLLWGIAPAIDDLRSSISKSAMSFLMDAALKLGHGLDCELDSLLPLLIRKAGSASLGKDNFLAVQADKVLVVFMTSVSPLRFVGAVLTTAAQKGSKLRSKVASLLAACLDSVHGLRLVEHTPTAEKMLLAIMSLQKEGQLDARLHAKQALFRMKELFNQAGISYNDMAAKLGCRVDPLERASSSPRSGGGPIKGPGRTIPVPQRKQHHHHHPVSSARRCSSVPLAAADIFRKL